MKNFRSLKVWQKAHEITLECYKVSKKFPDNERFGLTSQMRRCSASVAANIAEGCGRRGNAEFHRFLQIAAGSSNELDYHLLLARDLGYLPIEEHRKLETSLIEMQKMLAGLIAKVESDRLASAQS
ncbi:MAG: four helix bundle protein [Acidobacteriales bacterium]|nr:four helix bundle protein [Terriglobales bacterium]